MQQLSILASLSWIRDTPVGDEWHQTFDHYRLSLISIGYFTFRSSTNDFYSVSTLLGTTDSKRTVVGNITCSVMYTDGRKNVRLLFFTITLANVDQL